MASDIKFEFYFHETIITCGVDLLLGIVDTKTKGCHGTVSLISVVPSETMNRKRRVARNRNVRTVNKVFLCDYCDYESNAKYMTDRHIRRIHEESAVKHKCKFCNFTSMYPFNIKRHVTRTHKDVVEILSESSSLTVRPRRTVIESSDTSGCNSIRNTVGMSFEKGSDVSSFWAM